MMECFNVILVRIPTGVNRVGLGLGLRVPHDHRKRPSSSSPSRPLTVAVLCLLLSAAVVFSSSHDVTEAILNAVSNSDVLGFTTEHGLYDDGGVHDARDVSDVMSNARDVHDVMSSARDVHDVMHDVARDAQDDVDDVMHNVSRTLEDLLDGYDTRLRPQFGGKRFF